jgi:branched-chain amino acid transport system ATP-binding protein
LLNCENLSVAYGKIEALHGLTLSVDSGEIVALIGANGAGKSTIINTISGLIIPKTGEILFRGDRISSMPPEAIVRKGLIQVAEGRQLFPTLTVWENLIMGAYTVRDKTKFDEYLRVVFELFPILEKKKNDMAQTMSGGEQQMLAIARALMAVPKMVMLDEPSLGLAPFLVVRIFQVIRNLNRDLGLPILLVEQNVYLSLKISSRGYVLERGKIVLEDRSEELMSNPDVEAAYMGV